MKSKLARVCLIQGLRLRMELSMKRKFVLLIVLSLTFSLLFSCAQEKSETQNSATKLSTEGQKVVDYLLDDWNKNFRSTSIPLAMSNLGMKPNDGLRLEVGQYLREHTDLANNLKWWGANNYILSNNEKLIAKYLMNTYKNEQRNSGLQKLSEGLALSENYLQGRLAFMAKAGLLQESSEEKLGYVLAEGYNKWGGPLRYNFHTVAIAGEKSFDVW